MTDGVCSNLITTNYDLFFDTIWKKYPDFIGTNPILDNHEYDWEGYYSSRKNKRCYWKIHGSLSHVVFKSEKGSKNPYIFSLPRFAVSSNKPGIATAYRLKHTIPYLGYEAHVYTKTDFCQIRHLSPRFIPYIDWSFGNNRSLFNKEILGAKTVLSKPDSIAAIVLIGFRGFYDPKGHPWNEELYEDLIQLLDSGYNNIYMAVHAKQYAHRRDRESNLMQRLIKAKHCWGYRSIRDFFESVLALSMSFPLSLVEDEYLHWKMHWFLTGRERIYKGGI
jgi:hypothetical protein